MLRTLRAFAWMRWRILLNSLERTGSRDTLERLSLAVDQIGPIIAFVLFVPSAIALAAAAGYAGYRLSAGETVFAFEAIRILLLVACGFAIVGPLLLPSIEPTTIVRLLLLPIPRTTLYAAHTAGALAEPWVLLSVPVALALPIGLMAGGAWLAAAVAVVGGLFFIVSLVGLATFAALLLHLAVRDRRRGELLALIFIVLVPALSVLPTLLLQSRDRSPRETTHRERPQSTMPAWVTRTADAAQSVVPSEVFIRSVRRSANREPAAAVVPILMLAVSGLVFHGLGFVTFGRLLSSPLSGARRASSSRLRADVVRLPIVSRATGAIAVAQLRLALRTPRGRSILLSPLIVFVLIGIIMNRQGDMEVAGVGLANGLNLAAFGGAVCVLALQPFAMNQFAIDRAGLTMMLLSPVRSIELLVGKALGIGLVAAAPAIACALIAAVFVGGGTPVLWLSLPPALLASYFLLAPAAAVLSMLFPRTVDLNSIGRGSNPHSLASLLGLIVFVLSNLPSILIVALTTAFLRRPALTPVVMTVWCGLALVASRFLFVAAVAIFEKRKENLGLVAS